MNDKNRNLVIGLLSVGAAVIMFAALSLAIGKWSFGSSQHLIRIHFPIVQGIDSHSEVKLAGAPAGHVISIRLIPRAEQDLDPITNTYNFVEVTAELDSDVEIDSDFRAVIKQDGLGIAPKYLLFVPGTDRHSPPLPDDKFVQGEETPDLTDLAKPLADTLQRANAMLEAAGPLFNTMKNLPGQIDDVAKNLNIALTTLNPVVDHADGLIDVATKFLGDYDSPVEREKLSKMLSNLDVTTDNLKVVSTNSKALTQTLAEKPWRLLFGGKTVLPPPEQEVLDANHPILLYHPDTHPTDQVKIPLRRPAKPAPAPAGILTPTPLPKIP